jgi:hypothetical protein
VRYLLDIDHISFLQRRSGPEYAALADRLTTHLPEDFALSVASFHEQVLGAHTFIIRARTTADTVRGYALLLEILQGFLLWSPDPQHLQKGSDRRRRRARPRHQHGDRQPRQRFEHLGYAHAAFVRQDARAR